MTIIPISNQRHIKLFHSLPAIINQGDSHFIAPLWQEVERVFTPARNKYFTHGSCERWILMHDNKCIGRIAAFINDRNAKSETQPTGGCGFFECIKDRDAAFLLFDIAREWLESRGMEAMDGPINFGERNAWWGLLVEGFSPPTYQMNYNPPYYEEFFDAYGFKDYFRQYSYELPVAHARPQKYEAYYQQLLTQGYRFEHANKSNMDKYAEDFRLVYNQGWARHHNFKEMTVEQSQALLQSMKPIMVDYLLWFAYYQGQPVAMFIMLPELNQWFQYLHGDFNWWGILKFLFHKTFTRNEKIFGTIFGVIPSHQRRGVEAGIVMAADKVVTPKGIWKTIELTWIGDFNPKMMHTCETIGGKIVKTHVTYRKIFDPKAEFHRHPIID